MPDFKKIYLIIFFKLKFLEKILKVRLRLDVLYSTDQAVSGRAGLLLLHHALAVGGRQVRAGRGRAVGGRHHLRLPPADQPLVQMLTTETG